MIRDKWDPRKLLSVPAVYRLFGQLAAGDTGRRSYVETYVRAHPGQHVLDIGCGTGDLLDFLPDVHFTGFDSDADYVRAARERYGARARFFHGSVARQVDASPAAFDIVIANGILHHLDDGEASALFGAARTALKPGGRLVTVDGCYADGQSAFSRLLVSWDRGRHVRRREAYEALATQTFDRVKVAIRHDLLRIPYTHIIMECTA